MSKMGKGELESIAEKFKNEISTTNSVIEEIYLKIEEKDSIDLIKKMGLVYLMTYLEAFNRKFFIKFLSINPPVMAKSLKNKKDQKKLTMEYKDIVYDFYDEEGFLQKYMAKKMYNEVFDYYRLNIDVFISKFLDDFLELDFQNESQKRNIDIKMLKEFRKIRNSIVHYKTINLKEEINFKKCHNTVMDYITLVEELIFNKYYPQQELVDWF